eukprot:jgi/Chrzof1/2349/Cz11g11260.t1
MASAKGILERVLGLQGNELPDDSSAQRLATEVYATMDVDGSGTLPRQDVYDFLIMQLGVSHMQTVDKLFEHMSSDAAITVHEFVKSVTARYASLGKHKQLAIKKLEPSKAGALKVPEASAPKMQVLRGSERLNKLSQTSAFKVQVVTRESAKHMYEIFNDMDRKGEGRIGFPELKAYLARNKPQLATMAYSMFRTLDKDNKGSLSFKQMLRMFYPEAAEDDINKFVQMAKTGQEVTKVHIKTGTDAVLEEVSQVFEVYDADKTGSLLEEEFVQAIQLAGFSATEGLDIFSQVDKRSTGTINFSQFKTWYLQSKYAHTQQDTTLSQ